MLDDRIIYLIERCFPEPDRPKAQAALEACKPEWSHETVRCQIAAIAVSGGQLDHLHAAIDTYRIDFRDLLVAAGFAEDTKKHLTWQPDW
jgi:hypothetical protein